MDDIANVKFVYILWIGEDMPGLKKGRMVTYRGELEKLFEVSFDTETYCI